MSPVKWILKNNNDDVVSWDWSYQTSPADDFFHCAACPKCLGRMVLHIITYLGRNRHKMAAKYYIWEIEAARQLLEGLKTQEQ